MDNNCKIDFMNKEIRITKKFYKESQEFGTEAFHRMSVLLDQFPSFRITIPQTKNTNRNLLMTNPTYDFMMRYFRMNNDEEGMREFEHVRDLARYTKFGYNMVKRWFLSKYKPFFEEQDWKTVVA